MAGLLSSLYIQSTTWRWGRSRTHHSYSVEGREHRKIWTAMLLDFSNVKWSGTKLFVSAMEGHSSPHILARHPLERTAGFTPQTSPWMTFMKQHCQALEKCYQRRPTHDLLHDSGKGSGLTPESVQATEFLEYWSKYPLISISYDSAGTICAQ